MTKTKKTTFENVVLGARIFLNGSVGQKIDEPLNDKRNQYGQSSNCMWESGSGNPSFMKADDEVEPTCYSLKDEPKMRHV